jgi:hypothetical protein
MPEMAGQHSSIVISIEIMTRGRCLVSWKEALEYAPDQ